MRVDWFASLPVKDWRSWGRLGSVDRGKASGDQRFGVPTFADQVLLRTTDPEGAYAALKPSLPVITGSFERPPSNNPRALRPWRGALT